MPITINRKREIYDESGKAYEIGDCLYNVFNQGNIYSIKGCNDKVYVESSDIFANRYEVRNMSNLSKYTPYFERMFWPEMLTQDQKGFICQKPMIQGQFITMAEIIENRKTKKKLTLEEKHYYLSVGIQLAGIIDTVHKCSYVVGALSPEKIFVSSEGKVYSFLSYQFAFNNINAFDTMYYIAPEWFDKMNKNRIVYDEKSDAFLYALVLFQLLTGVFPFASDRDVSQVDKEELWGLMSDGKSVYFWEDETTISVIEEELSDQPPKIKELFRRAFDYCGQDNYVENRPSVNEWIRSLQDNDGI
ncbi:MAG: hypothetical protein K6D97_08815 [Clostridia bacterium]|nr:hypothetical protein [Clostridia bacterium]